MTMRFTISTLLLCLLVLSGCSSNSIKSQNTTVYSREERTLKAVYNDQLIENTITKNIYQSAGLSNTNLNVAAYNGVVLLIGQAPSEEDIQRLGDIAKAAPNVRLVENKITIGENISLISRAADALTTSQIKATMLLATDFPATEVKVYTENNIVYLMGLVSRDVANKAVQITKDTSNIDKIVKIFEYTD